MNDQKLQQLAMEYAEQNSPADIEDGVTEWERWHGAHIQAASGHCPYHSQCPIYKRTVEKYQKTY